VLALFIIVVPRNLPESARWQIHARAGKEAEATIAEIEGDVAKTKGELSPVDPSRELEIRPTEQIGHLALLRTLGRHPSRPGLGAALMITQSFLYNAIFFTSGLVLEFFFQVKAADTACYFMAFAAGNCWTGRFLLRLGRRLGPVSDRQRGVPAGGAGQGHRGVLRRRRGQVRGGRGHAAVRHRQARRGDLPQRRLRHRPVCRRLAGSPVRRHCVRGQRRRRAHLITVGTIRGDAEQTS
jgi:hypothetical protein